MNRRIARFIAAAIVAAAAFGCSGTGDGDLSPADIEAVRAASRAYVDGWLSNDPDRVMAALTGDAVMIPSGTAPLEGHEAIRAFWWPEGAAPATILEFTQTEDEVGGYGDVAFVRGLFSLAFEYDGTDYTNAGTYICLLRRLPDGAWRISHRMWSDQP